MGIADFDHQRHDEMGDELWARLKIEHIDPCEKCKGSGLVIVKTEFVDEIVPINRSEVCKCRQLCQHLLSLHDAGLPQEFWEANKLEPTFNVDCFAEIWEYARNLPNAVKHGLGFVLTGENGSGKSSSACIPLIEGIRQGITVAFINWPDFMKGHRKALTNNELGDYLDKRSLLDLVVLDEIGKERIGSDETFTASSLDSLLRMRRGAMLPTIITTNLERKEFTARYSTSVDSLIADRFKTLMFKPGDFRVKMSGTWNELLKGE